MRTMIALTFLLLSVISSKLCSAEDMSVEGILATFNRFCQTYVAQLDTESSKPRAGRVDQRPTVLKKAFINAPNEMERMLRDHVAIAGCILKVRKETQIMLNSKEFLTDPRLQTEEEILTCYDCEFLGLGIPVGSIQIPIKDALESIAESRTIKRMKEKKLIPDIFESYHLHLKGNGLFGSSLLQREYPALYAIFGATRTSFLNQLISQHNRQELISMRLPQLTNAPPRTIAICSILDQLIKIQKKLRLLFSPDMEPSVISALLTVTTPSPLPSIDPTGSHAPPPPRKKT